MKLRPRALSAFSSSALAARTDRLKKIVDTIRYTNSKATMANR